MEATTGFEPVNRGFADLRVKPLHHVAGDDRHRGRLLDRQAVERFGWPSRIRTSVHGSKVRCPTARRRAIDRPHRRTGRPDQPIRFCRGTVEGWSGRRDSNPRPSPWQGDALPTEPLPLADAPDVVMWCREPESNWRHRDFQSRALPTELSRHASGGVPSATSHFQAPGCLEDSSVAARGEEVPAGKTWILARPHVAWRRRSWAGRTPADHAG